MMARAISATCRGFPSSRPTRSDEPFLEPGLVTAACGVPILSDSTGGTPMRHILLCLVLSLSIPIAEGATAIAPVAAMPAPPAMKDPLGCKLIKASAYSYGLDHTGAFDPKIDLGVLLGEPGEGYGVVSPSTDKSDGDRD